jgi:glutamate-1-semialdehyde 2,1-aminomutase
MMTPFCPAPPEVQASPSACWDDFCSVFPGGVNSPVRSFPGMEVQPLIMGEGSGAYLRERGGKLLLDMCCSWGASLVGHAHPAVVEAVSSRTARGASFGITCEEELELARLVQGLFPSMEMMRWVNSGTEACMTALRIARGATRRQKVVKFVGHYHGHSDSLLVQAGSGVWGLNSTSSSAGVPASFVEHTLLLPFNDVEQLERLFANRDDLAAVIVEPVAGNMGTVPPLPGFLERLRQLTAESGAVLIFDEVMCGFRAAPGGAQQLYGITPDLTCLGKVVGGGFPVAAVGGRRDLMRCLAPLGSVYQAGTLAGHPVGMAAGIATLQLLQEKAWWDLHARVDRFQIEMEQLVASLRAQGRPACFQRQGLMFNLTLGVDQVVNHLDLQQVCVPTYQKLFQRSLEAGVYLPPSPFEAWFVSMAHSDADLGHLAEVLRQAVE